VSVDPQALVAEYYFIPGAKLAPADVDAVDLGAVSGPEVLEHPSPVAKDEPSVPAGDAHARKDDVARRVAAQEHRCLPDCATRLTHLSIARRAAREAAPIGGLEAPNLSGTCVLRLGCSILRGICGPRDAGDSGDDGGLAGPVAAGDARDSDASAGVDGRGIDLEQLVERCGTEQVDSDR